MIDFEANKDKSFLELSAIYELPMVEIIRQYSEYKATLKPNDNA